MFVLIVCIFLAMYTHTHILRCNTIHKINRYTFVTIYMKVKAGNGMECSMVSLLAVEGKSSKA